jgi:catechol 2,3-dioxygenase-like lactoylglutathione lyase family enzyme
MKAERIFETILYASDLKAAESFYTEVLGLDVVSRFTPLAVAFRCGQGVLLIFDPEQSRPSGRPVPSHGAVGEGHIAFGVAEKDLDPWRDHLENQGVEIEAVVDWDDDEGRSIYFRDPAGNSVELAPPTLWGGGWRFG